MRNRIKLNDPCGAVAGRPAMSANRWAVLLAGGDGIRLLELTRRISGDSRPKQFCRLIADRSLFEQTRERIDPLFPRTRQVPVLSRAHEKYYAGAVAKAAESRALVQPENRGTGIAIALASLHILSRDPQAMVSVFPCDHYYADEESFRATILSAENCAERHPGSIVLVGAEAEYPAMPSPLREHSVELSVQSCRVPAQFRSTEAGLTTSGGPRVQGVPRSQRVHVIGKYLLSWGGLLRRLSS